MEHTIPTDTHHMEGTNRRERAYFMEGYSMVKDLYKKAG